jgi:hypothetical protein
MLNFKWSLVERKSKNMNEAKLIVNPKIKEFLLLSQKRINPFWKAIYAACSDILNLVSKKRGSKL